MIIKKQLPQSYSEGIQLPRHFVPNTSFLSQSTDEKTTTSKKLVADLHTSSRKQTIHDHNHPIKISMFCAGNSPKKLFYAPKISYKAIYNKSMDKQKKYSI
jgi:hypothetical protein